MVSPRRWRATAALLLSALLPVMGNSAFPRDDAKSINCKEPFKLSDKLAYNLSSLDAEHTISRNRDTPPSTMVDAIRFNICADLKAVDGAKSEDQCPSGTRACLTKTNKKGSDSDRVVAVIPLAQSSPLSPSTDVLTSPKGLRIVLHGPAYPSSSGPAQSVNLTLICESSASDPTLADYDGKVARIEWKTPAACAKSEDAPPKGDDGKGNDGKGGDDTKQSVGSGVGWFFLALFLGFIAYFGLGAYYNYSTYGATGADLIPHRDFWREVPYMLKDVVAHLFSSVRSRQPASRSGYMAV